MALSQRCSGCCSAASAVWASRDPRARRCSLHEPLASGSRRSAPGSIGVFRPLCTLLLAASLGRSTAVSGAGRPSAGAADGAEDLVDQLRRGALVIEGQYERRDPGYLYRVGVPGSSVPMVPDPWCDAPHTCYLLAFGALPSGCHNTAGGALALKDVSGKPIKGGKLRSVQALATGLCKWEPGELGGAEKRAAAVHGSVHVDAPLRARACCCVRRRAAAAGAYVDATAALLFRRLNQVAAAGRSAAYVDAQGVKRARGGGWRWR